MNSGKSIFSQIVSHLPERYFRRLVEKYRGNHRVRTFSCWDQLNCMLFAQLSYRESLRDIEACLNSAGPRLYHLGIRGKVSRSNLARANANRDWLMYQELALHLIDTARNLYSDESLSVDLQNAVYAFDSTTIDLCLSIFPWARFMDGTGGRRKGAIKLHTLLDLRSNIPTFICISDGKMSDMRALDYLPIESGAFYVLDRGYQDFERLYRFTLDNAFFVTRPRKQTMFSRISSAPADQSIGILSDQIVKLGTPRTLQRYPKNLRRIRYLDAESGKTLTFISNNMSLHAETITKLYRSRWQVELFFRWIKQNLRIKQFYGYSENAVKTQIWIAISTYVLVAIVKKRLGIQQPLYTILQVFSVSLFDKTPILSAFQRGLGHENLDQTDNQLNLFES